jgi:hypothetical protein
MGSLWMVKQHRKKGVDTGEVEFRRLLVEVQQHDKKVKQRRRSGNNNKNNETEGAPERALV